jgi:pilus assembly protein CpaB
VRGRRRRGLLLLSLALASGGLAASLVHQRERSVEARVGPLVPVLVAARDLPADARLGRGALAVRRVPARYVPSDAIGSAGEVAGTRTAVALAAGSYLTAGHVQGTRPGGAGRGPVLRRGERALELGVRGGGALAEAAPGARVDVVVTTEGGGGSGRSFIALEDVELLALRDNAEGASFDSGEQGRAPATLLATLRVTPRQAVYLAAAESYGREVRLLVRPPGDRSRTGSAAVREGEL